jgi:YVTN family beta-propeller protein
MRALRCLSILCLVSCVFGQQAPWGRGDIPVSARDRVYAADQTSNTVSVIDPSSNKLLGMIRLGDPVPGALSPLYRGELLVHGLGYSPDSKTLAVVSVASNSVTLIDTATNAIKEKPTERGPFRRLVLSRRLCMQSPHRLRRRPGDSLSLLT